MGITPALLLPRPKRAAAGESRLELRRPTRIVLADDNPALRSAALQLEKQLARFEIAAEIAVLGVPSGSSPPGAISLRLLPGSLPHAAAYRLSVSPNAVEVAGADEPGLHHGVTTLGQWIELHAAARETGLLAVAALRVEDWPDFSHRGVLLDVSRDKVPTQETLYGLVDLLAGWKINQLQLYTEHTFAYAGHEAVWRDASPLTPTEVRELDAYCRQRFVELVPNQNSLGHFHRWLVHDAYRDLAECPEGVEHPFSARQEPFSLCPTDPKAVELLRDLYSQLLPLYTSGLFNAGLDETFDVGQGRSAAACAERGRGVVHVDFVRRIHRLATEHRKRLQLWADIALEHPEMLKHLPRDLVALDWGYEADHPFIEETRRLAASGLDFYVCPGTSSWNSFAGRTENTLANLRGAARAGLDAGALGYLVTDWGDFGHLQPLPVSYLGFLVGAEAAWNVDAASARSDDEIPHLLDLHAFRDGARRLGRVAFDLGNVYREVGITPKNASTLFQLVLFAGDTLEHRRFDGLERAGLGGAIDATHRAVDGLAAARPTIPDGNLAMREFLYAADLLRFAGLLGLDRLAAGRDKALSDLPWRRRRALRKQLAALLREHKAIWLARNREGGRKDSAERLRAVRRLLR